LPSSLTEGRSSTWVSSTRPPVSVCGTDTVPLARGFSRRYGLDPYGLGSPPRLTLASRRDARADLPTRTAYRLGGLAPRNLAPRVPPSLVTGHRGTGILTRRPSPTARALGLGPPHPQLISMAAEPLGIRWGGFAPPSRYSCRHSHSPPLHRPSRGDFTADGDAPLPRFRKIIHGVGHGLEPRWIVGATARSTSELLRTLSRMAASKPTSWLSARRDRLAHLARRWGP
jgi:hypothetical protein